MPVTQIQPDVNQPAQEFEINNRTVFEFNVETQSVRKIENMQWNALWHEFARKDLERKLAVTRSALDLRAKLVEVLYATKEVYHVPKVWH